MTKNKPMRPVVDLGRMLANYVNESNGNTAVFTGATMANNVLLNITKRAIELNDEVLLDELKSICYVGED